jgi:hypothetical protein
MKATDTTNEGNFEKKLKILMAGDGELRPTMGVCIYDPRSRGTENHDGAGSNTGCSRCGGERASESEVRPFGTFSLHSGGHCRGPLAWLNSTLRVLDQERVSPSPEASEGDTRARIGGEHLGRGQRRTSVKVFLGQRRGSLQPESPLEQILERSACYSESESLGEVGR